jgi:hypothetical protein
MQKVGCSRNTGVEQGDQLSFRSSSSSPTARSFPPWPWTFTTAVLAGGGTGTYDPKHACRQHLSAPPSKGSNFLQFVCFKFETLAC